MDNYSASQVARMLGTNVPRVKRAVRRLGLDVDEGPHGRVRLTRAQVAAIGARLGATAAVADLSRLEVLVLAALAHAPLGLVSIRAVARRAGVSPTAAGRAIDRLVEQRLVSKNRELVAAGGARELDVYRAAFDSPDWPQIAPRLTRVRLPRGRARHRDARVPVNLRHLFWNTAPSQLDVARGGSYIARRLLTTNDLSAIAWGAANLDAHDWEHAAGARGIDPSRRALALNIARRGARRG